MNTNNLLRELKTRMAALHSDRQKWEARFDLDNPATALVKMVEDLHDWFDFATMTATEVIPEGTEVLMYVSTMDEWMQGIIRGYVEGDSRNYASHYIVQEEGKAAYEPITQNYIAPRGVVEYVESIEGIIATEVPNLEEFICWTLQLESDLGVIKKVHLQKDNGVAIVEVYNGATMDKLLYRMDGTPLFVTKDQVANSGLYLRNTEEARKQAAEHVYDVFFNQNSPWSYEEKMSRSLAQLLAVKRAEVPIAPETKWGLTPEKAAEALSFLKEPINVITSIHDEATLSFVVRSFGFKYDSKASVGESHTFPCVFRAIDDASYTVTGTVPNGSRTQLTFEDFITYAARSNEITEGYKSASDNVATKVKRRPACMSLPVCCDAGTIDRTLSLGDGLFKLQISTIATKACGTPLEIAYNDRGEPVNRCLAGLEQFLLRNQVPNADQVRYYIEKAIHNMSDTADVIAETIVDDLESAGAFTWAASNEGTEGQD